MNSKYVVGMCVLLFSLLCGCENGANQKLIEQEKANLRLVSENSSLTGENEKLKSRIRTLESENQELSNTPERRLAKINKLIEKRDTKSAAAEIALLKSKFPQAPEVERAEKLISALEEKIHREYEEAEARDRLGFKILKEVKSFSSPGLKISVGSPQITGQWTFDSYGDTYHYRDAERGGRFIVARLSVTADKAEKDPSLPGLGVYEIQGKKLNRLGTLSYEFVRWDDYGSYLGNEADFKNDFAHTATIPFTLGVQLPEEKLQEPVLLIAARSNCHSRSSERFANPPVSYTGYCTELKSELTLDEVSSDKYFVLKIWNASKL